MNIENSKNSTISKDVSLEERKVLALEKIGLSLDALTLWFEEIDKEEWGSRLEYYLHLAYLKYLKEDQQDQQDSNSFNI